MNKEFCKKQIERCNYVINKVRNKNWLCLPEEYEKNPERAIKHFEEEKEYYTKKLNGNN